MKDSEAPRNGFLPQGEGLEDPAQEQNQQQEEPQTQELQHEPLDQTETQQVPEELTQQLLRLQQLLISGRSNGSVQELLAAAVASAAAAPHMGDPTCGSSSYGCRSSNSSGTGKQGDRLPSLPLGEHVIPATGAPISVAEVTSERSRFSHDGCGRTLEYQQDHMNQSQRPEGCTDSRGTSTGSPREPSSILRTLPLLLEGTNSLWDFNSPHEGGPWGPPAPPVVPSDSPFSGGHIGLHPLDGPSGVPARGMTPGYPSFNGEPPVAPGYRLSPMVLEAYRGAGGPGGPSAISGAGSVTPYETRRISADGVFRGADALRGPTSMRYGIRSPQHTRGPMGVPLSKAASMFVDPKMQQQRWVPGGCPPPRTAPRGKQLFFYCPSCLEAFPSSALSLFAAHISQKGHTVQQLQRLRGSDGYFQCPKCTCKGSDLLGLLRHWHEGGAAHHGQKIMKHIRSRDIPPGLSALVPLQQQHSITTQQQIQQQRLLLHQSGMAEGIRRPHERALRPGAPRLPHHQQINPSVYLQGPPRDRGSQLCTSPTPGAVEGHAFGGASQAAAVAVGASRAKANVGTEFRSTTGSQRSSAVSDDSEEGTLQNEQQQKQLSGPRSIIGAGNDGLGGMFDTLPLTRALLGGGAYSSYIMHELQLQGHMPLGEGGPRGPNRSIVPQRGSPGLLSSRSDIWGPLPYLPSREQQQFPQQQQQQHLGFAFCAADVPSLKPKPNSELQQLLQ
ncbi:uncharacterized protein LOC34618507, partial [Cyclospora cayetanensis]|uniref:Uncharacterized protein LOC34618507 n=1 Tax=Cyclospora cayetanensis TaxID=88456 RepID=A0A6P6RYY3_9EIME